jgi:hypothetical protein
MLFGNKVSNDAHFYGNKFKKGIKFGAKRVAGKMHNVNSILAPALVLGGMAPLAAGLKATEGLASGLSRI